MIVKVKEEFIESGIRIPLNNEFGNWLPSGVEYRATKTDDPKYLLVEYEGEWYKVSAILFDIIVGDKRG